jgi:hypothetical protein
MQDDCHKTINPDKIVDTNLTLPLLSHNKGYKLETTE